MTPVFLSDSVFLHFGTSSASTGAAANADSTPTVNVAEDGVAMGYAPTVTNITTGLYMVQIDATAGNGFEAGKRYSVYVAATVGGIEGRDGLGEFEVLAVDLNAGVASVSGLTAANLDVAVSTRLATSGYTAPPTTSAIELAVNDGVVEGAVTVRQSLRLANAANAAKVSGAATSTFTIRDLADTKDRIVATVDADGNRTAVTRDLT